MIGLWLRGMIRRPGWTTAEIGGIGIAVAVVACLGAFLAHSQATMTGRAVARVAVDWQVQLTPGTDPAAVTDAMTGSVGVDGLSTVMYGTSTGLTVNSPDSVQTTGAAVVLGVPVDYLTKFPGEVRPLTGTTQGALLAQQTAANLHAAPGDTVLIGRAGLSDFPVTVAGVVDLPLADSLFGPVKATSAARTAPPDNVLLLPEDQWHQVFAGLTDRADLVSTQIHVRLDHHLPSDPASAYTFVNTAANNVEATAAGAAVVGDNLATALAAARSDAAYAQILFLFLGLPGAVLAALLTAGVATAGRGRRRGEHALLRARGASTGDLVRLVATETAVIGVAGSIIGLAAAAVVGHLTFGGMVFGSGDAGSTAGLGWAALAVGVGVGIAALTILMPAVRDLRAHTVATQRAPVTPTRTPGWARIGLDVMILTAAALVVVAASRTGYQLVLAPEGSPTIAVSYWVFAGPALLWLGSALLAWRCADLLLGRGRPVVRAAISPLTGPLATPLASMLARQRRPLTRAIVILAMAVAFAVSTATFNTTYAAQAEIDAQLTNGADVTVVLPPGGTLSPAEVAALDAVPGVRAVEPMQHRYAYIGNDLQDLYGVRPATITAATALQDSYFTGGTAADLLATLSHNPDGILVSAETVTDYRLQLGDPLTLRLVDQRTHQPTTVTFHYVGVVKEFPTAPRDSFFVTNADYVAAQTGTGDPGVYLIDTGGGDTAAIADQVREIVRAAATVTDITGTRTTIGSTLTAVDLSGLTRVELGFALVVAGAAAALVFGLTLADRRRALAICYVLGAGRRQLRNLINAEAAVLGVVGTVAGVLVGAVLSVTLITVLTGVFDPPPSSASVPWGYLIGVGAVIAVALAGVGAVMGRSAARDPMAVLREL